MTSDTETQEIDPIDDVVRGLEGGDVATLRAIARDAQDRAHYAGRCAETVRQSAAEAMRAERAHYDALRTRLCAAAGYCPDEVSDDELVAAVEELRRERAELVRRVDHRAGVVEAAQLLADAVEDGGDAAHAIECVRVEVGIMEGRLCSQGPREGQPHRWGTRWCVDCGRAVGVASW